MHDLPAASATDPHAVREPFFFNGSTREYFGIWIVNVLLTMVTFGIYSAWATVRRHRYFYGNTEVAGATFDYHARPRQILIGRILVGVAAIGYGVLLRLSPATAALALAALLVAMPWLIVRGLRFNARVTSYRNVRFDFAGTYWGAVKAYVLGPLVAYLTLGLALPVATRWMWHFILGNARYGGRPVATQPALGALYRQMLLPAVLYLIGLAAFIAAVVGLGPMLRPGASSLGSAGGTLPVAHIAILVAVLPLFVVSGALYLAGVRNVVFNATVFDGRHWLVSALGRRRFLWVSVTNVLATVLSLGLARPWAAVRMARLMASATALDVLGSLEDYAGQVGAAGSALGAEYMASEGLAVAF